MRRQTTTLLSLIVFLQSTTTTTTASIPACSTIEDCEDCLSNGCVFSIGTCYDACRDTDRAATCYGTENSVFQIQTASHLCGLYDGDNARCNGQTSCRDCVTTLKSDGNACHWYDSVQACFGGGEGPFGSGSLACPEDQLCAAATDCQSCLEANCAWWHSGVCTPVCPENSDTDCYTLAQFPNFVEPLAVCQAVASTITDRELCFGHMDCGSCTSTVKTDGTHCQWYKDSSTGVEWCQAGGCNSNGICGSTNCHTNSIKVPDRNVTSPLVDVEITLPVATDTADNTNTNTDATATTNTEQETTKINPATQQQATSPPSLEPGEEQANGSLNVKEVIIVPPNHTQVGTAQQEISAGRITRASTPISALVVALMALVWLY